MHKKIQDLAYARFQYERPEVEFSTEQLEIEVFKDDTCHGSFSFTCINDRMLRGMVFSSDPGMECLTQDFEGTQIEIPFEFHSKGLKEGETGRGEITIIYNGGEYSLPFVATVIPFFVRTSIGKVETLHEFVRLAQESYEEAYAVFRSPDFEKLIGKTEEKERLLYQSMVKDRITMQTLEEFLVGIGKKQRVTIHIEEFEKKYTNVTEDTRESIRIKKEHWGYLELSVTSDNMAIEPVKKRITTADFIGNYVDAEFLIRAGKLHGGRNYARITIESTQQKHPCEICVQMRGAENQAERKARKQLLTKITRLYLDFRMQRIVTGVWSRETCICLEHLREAEPDNLWYVLYQAQALLINKQRQEAEWLLNTFRRKSIKKDSPLYAYYLYLCTLMEREPSYVTKTVRQITEIYHKNQEDIRLFFIMLFLDAELNQSRSRKLAVIEEKVSQGIHSPVLYMEAYQLICHDIYLLQKAGNFERQVLYWAVKEGTLTVPVTRRVSQYMMQIKQFHPLWYEILKACYLKNPEPELLQTICSFCIKWNLHSGEQFEWYDKGVREELRIAGLYEAWLDSAGTEQIEQIPRAVKLYFQYQNNESVLRRKVMKNSNVREEISEDALVFDKTIDLEEKEEELTGEYYEGADPEAEIREIWDDSIPVRGSIQRLEQLWVAARESGLPTYEMEERFLTQLFYTEGYTDRMEEIFRSYYDSQGQELILMAGLSYFSYRYFVRNTAVADIIFECLEQQVMLGNSMNDCCRLAYFKWLTGKKDPTEKQKELLEGFLQEYLRKEMYFAFYQELPEKFLRKYHLYDKVILEYRTNPSHKVSVQYRYTETRKVQENAESEGCKVSAAERSCQEDDQEQKEAIWQNEEMKQMYEGIFVKQFVVFSGEEVSCVIEDRAPAKKKCDSDSGSCKEMMEYDDEHVTRKRDSLCLTGEKDRQKEGAYGMLNAMMADLQEKDMKKLCQQYQQYRKLQQQTEEYFKPL